MYEFGFVYLSLISKVSFDGIVRRRNGRSGSIESIPLHDQIIFISLNKLLKRYSFPIFMSIIESIYEGLVAVFL